MPINPDLLEILCCPASKTPVEMVGRARLDRLNAAIAAGYVRYTDGAPVEEALEEALATTDGRTVYRIDDGIPVMLVDRGIPTDQVGSW